MGKFDSPWIHCLRVTQSKRVAKADDKIIDVSLRPNSRDMFCATHDQSLDCGSAPNRSKRPEISARVFLGAEGISPPKNTIQERAANLKANPCFVKAFTAFFQHLPNLFGLFEPRRRVELGVRHTTGRIACLRCPWQVVRRPKGPRPALARLAPL